MGVNYLGHVYLSNLLLPLLKASAPSRLVWVASPDETIAEPDWSNIRWAEAAGARTVTVHTLVRGAPHHDTIPELV
jgi:hypothetical protein